MNSCNTDNFLATTIICSLSALNKNGGLWSRKCYCLLLLHKESKKKRARLLLTRKNDCSHGSFERDFLNCFDRRSQENIHGKLPFFALILFLTWVIIFFFTLGNISSNYPCSERRLVHFKGIDGLRLKQFCEYVCLIIFWRCFLRSSASHAMHYDLY